MSWTGCSILFFAAPTRELAAARARSSGFGLGLALARRIAQAHGGSIRAINIPGGGARIEIRFPRQSAPSAFSPEPLLGEPL
jgi:K+-sensing histidine kinase KdpD